MERASFFELRASALKAAQEVSPFSWGRELSLAACGEGPIIHLPVPEWVESYETRSGTVSMATSFGRMQFVRFVSMMNAFNKRSTLLRLPPFRIGELSCWRTFVAVFPKSLAARGETP